ncbi:MAG: hypothetical protein R3F14_08830 [Polyangiaceae bacterium]
MSATREDKSSLRGSQMSWAVWAERALVRALEIEPREVIQGGLLTGESTSQVTLTIARAVGYIAGAHRAPDLAPELRAWIDRVTPGLEGPAKNRLGGLSWAEWAERAAVIALEIESDLKLEGSMLAGQYAWEVAIVIARAIGCLAGVRREWGVPVEVRAWLQGGPRLAVSAERSVQSKEETR